MRLHVNGEKAVLFFRYKRNYLDKRNHVRADITEKLTPARMSIAQTDKEQVLLELLPPNICECFITKGWDIPKHGEEHHVPKVAYGHSWRHPKDNHDKHLARKKALASAISSWPQGARRLMWKFYHQHGAQLILDDWGHVIGHDPWMELDISTLAIDYPEPESKHKGIPLSQQKQK